MKDVYAIDTNLLLLLVVGTASPALIPLHKRTHAYTIDDYRLLERILSLADHVVLTPGVCASSLAVMCRPTGSFASKSRKATGAIVHRSPGRARHKP